MTKKLTASLELNTLAWKQNKDFEPYIKAKLAVLLADEILKEKNIMALYVEEDMNRQTVRFQATLWVADKIGIITQQPQVWTSRYLHPPRKTNIGGL